MLNVLIWTLAVIGLCAVVRYLFRELTVAFRAIGLKRVNLEFYAPEEDAQGKLNDNDSPTKQLES